MYNHFALCLHALFRRRYNIIAIYVPYKLEFHFKLANLFTRIYLGKIKSYCSCNEEGGIVCVDLLNKTIQCFIVHQKQ